MMSDSTSQPTLIAQFVTTEGEPTGSQLELPRNVTSSQLETLINHLLQNEEKLPYSFFVGDTEVTGELGSVGGSGEEVLRVAYQPQALFRVRPVTRSTASLPGHADSVLSLALKEWTENRFSPDGEALASAGGDATVRLWDMGTQTPRVTCKGHVDWILALAWAPHGNTIASGSKDGTVRVWDRESGKQVGKALEGHKQFITALAWEPLHLGDRLASASKDGSVRLWDVRLGQCLSSLSAHSLSVTALKWGGEGYLYSASQDRTIKVWSPDGQLRQTLQGHAHWVNSLALNSDFVLRKGAHDHLGTLYPSKEAAREAAREHYTTMLKGVGNTERLVSGSDDFTMFLWEPMKGKKPLTRMTGHQQLINMVAFSPDGLYIASASFDKSIKLWHGITGKFITTLRGHVEAVYQIAWSPDSRMLVSGSRDSTLKVWEMRTKSLQGNLPGHADQVFAVDWSPDGAFVASGSKDRLVKLWRN